jgi:hypothetical protein
MKGKRPYVGKNRKEMGITNSKDSHEILIVKR